MVFGRMRLSGLLLVGCFALVGCSAASEEMSSVATGSGGPAVKMGAQPESADAAASAEGKMQGRPAIKPDAQKHLERVLRLRFRVADGATAMADAVKAVQSVGGQVRFQNTGDLQYDHQGGYRDHASPYLELDRTGLIGRLVAQVPHGKYLDLQGELSGLGKELSRTEATTARTAEVVDVAARINAQEASIERLQELLKRAGDVGELAKVEGELSRRIADLEAQKAVQKSLTQRTSNVTVVIGFYGETGREGAADPSWGGELKAVVSGALEYSRLALTYGIGAAVWVVATLGVPIALVVGLVMWRKRKRRKENA